MPSARAAHRKLSDYCGIFAEKTNRIGRNVGSFMQSRGLLPIRRSVDETAARPARRDASRINGDVIRNNPMIPRADLETRENHRRRDENRNHERDANASNKRVVYSNSTYPRDARTNASYVHRANETEPRRSRRREYAEASYEATDEILGQGTAARGGPSVFTPILRNGINYGGDERPYYSTLPRRSRTINFKDKARDSPEGRQRAYPKSLQDLTDLELDDIAYFPSSRGGRREKRLDDDYRRRARDRREEDEIAFDDDYLRLCRNLSRLDGYPRGGRYEPGQVHYERECRTFGKDTVAFIYYKTCYL